MFYRKYVAFFDAVYPWVSICCTTWWVDRLLVEFGHRVPDSEICTHSDLQYVKWHQVFTVVAVVSQTIHATKKRSKQLERECLLMLGKIDRRCFIYVFISQLLLCIFWCAVIVTIVDFSPWLCMTSILHRRATIAFFSLMGAFVSFHLDARIYSWLLQRQLPTPPLSI